MLCSPGVCDSSYDLTILFVSRSFLINISFFWRSMFSSCISWAFDLFTAGHKTEWLKMDVEDGRSFGFGCVICLMRSLNSRLMPGRSGTFPLRKRCQSGPFFGSGPPPPARIDLKLVWRQLAKRKSSYLHKWWCQAKRYQPLANLSNLPVKSHWAGSGNRLLQRAAHLPM